MNDKTTKTPVAGRSACPVAGTLDIVGDKWSLLIGLAAALAPQLWMKLFSQDPEVIAAGVGYLQRAAPFYGFYGFGMALYFASQGAGKVLWPVIAGFTRLLVATAGGWYWVVVLGGSIEGLYWLMAASLCLFGVVNAAAFGARLSWGRREAGLQPLNARA